MKIIASSITQPLTDFLHAGYVSSGYAVDQSEVNSIGGLLGTDGVASWPDIFAFIIALAVVIWALSPLILSARSLWNPPDKKPR